METNNNLALISAEDLSFVPDNILNERQLSFILSHTPKKYIQERPAKGGGKWEYVSGGYVKKCLNLMFGWDWDFEIIEEKVMFGEAIVKGKLTCRSNGKVIVKMQYGNKDIIFKKDFDKDGNRVPLSIGNDLKSAATDALKKCAAELGIAADIYNKQEFKEIKVKQSKTKIDWDLYSNLFEQRKDLIHAKYYNDVLSVLESKDASNYEKMLNYLNAL